MASTFDFSAPTRSFATIFLLHFGPLSRIMPPQLATGEKTSRKAEQKAVFAHLTSAYELPVLTKGAKNMKPLVLLLSILLIVPGVATAIPDPAAVYCIEQGYEYENGVCIFPDGSECGAWQYYCNCEPNGIGCWQGDFNCAFPCRELSCRETGQFVSIGECCPGLAEIPRIEAYDDQCNLVGWLGWVFICSDCGDGICESWESICNCPQDCAPVHNITQDTYHETIQDAIDDANDGDTILAKPGLYGEHINFLGKNIILTSIDPTDPNIVNDTIIDGVVAFRGTEDPNCTLTGFNIDGGIRGFYWPPPGSGTDHTHATISHCLLDDVVTGCDATITGCDGTISNCLITEAAHMCTMLMPATIVGCHGLIKNCTIISGQTAVIVWPDAESAIENCIIYQYSTDCPVGVAEGATVNISYTDVLGGLDAVCGDGTVNWGPGNIDADPCFVDPSYGDYHLLETSPCIDAGDPNYIPAPNETDLDGNPRLSGYAVDMGAYEYPQPVPVEIDIRPKTLNLRSKGKSITCHIRLPEGYNVTDIDPNSILLEGQIGASSVRSNHRQQTAIATFSRSDVQDILDVGQTELTITGQLTDGTEFMGTDTIKVINNRARRTERATITCPELLLKSRKNQN